MERESYCHLIVIISSQIINKLSYYNYYTNIAIVGEYTSVTVIYLALFVFLLFLLLILLHPLLSLHICARQMIFLLPAYISLTISHPPTHTSLHRATINICLGNYIEHLVHRTVGLQAVYPFLASFASL